MAIKDTFLNGGRVAHKIEGIAEESGREKNKIPDRPGIQAQDHQHTTGGGVDLFQLIFLSSYFSEKREKWPREKAQLSQLGSHVQL